jgi:uncharacterized membrane protein YkvA (DUF1232 family)
MKPSDIEKEIRRIQSSEYCIAQKNFLIKNKDKVLTNMCSDRSMLHSSKEYVKQLFDIVENHDDKIKITGIVAMAIGALLYVISPMDFVPDFISVVGFVDDVIIVKRIIREIVKNKAV